MQWQAYGGIDTRDHHPSYKDLSQSAEMGCKVCALFRKAVLLHYNLYHPDSRQSAEEYHQELDAVDDNIPFQVSTAETAIDYEHAKDPIRDYQMGLQGFRVKRKYRYALYGAYETCAMVSVSSQPGMYTSHLLRGCIDIDAYDEGSDPLRYWHIFGRQPAAFPDLILAKEWLEECLESHPQCSKPRNAPLPLRLLDLQNPRSASSDLCLAVNAKEKGTYATLSHCWGNSQPLRLLQENLAEFESCIAFSSLPRTFQDAVTVTRSLGLRYLWIDSLCILQDSVSDWEKHCSEMARIYKNSYVTLAGPAASGCESGFLHPRQNSDAMTIQLDDEGVEVEVSLSCHNVGGDSHCFSPERNSPLSKRSWVLQERILSGRALNFGTSRMYLECHTNVQFEDCHYPVKWEDDEIGIVVKRPTDNLGRGSDAFKYWDALVSTYSGLDATKRTDKLPALSGLASEFEQRTACRYVAGHWQEDMPRSLAWFESTKDKTSSRSFSTMGSTIEYIAPSWSWASSSFKVNFISHPGHPFSSKLKILELKVIQIGLDPRGMLESGYIDVAGLVLHGVAKMTGPRSAHFRSGRWSADAMGWDWDGRDGGAYDVGDAEIDVHLLYLGSGEYQACLIIEPVDGQENHYRRVGLVSTRGHDDNIERARRTDSEHKQLRLI